jgi:hypothetical protein
MRPLTSPSRNPRCATSWAPSRLYGFTANAEGYGFPVMTANQHDMSVATNVANRLREAVLATRATNQWFPDQLHVLDLVQHSVAQWAYDIGATLRDIDDALASSRASPDREEVHDHDPVAALEDALVGAVGVRDRLRSLAVLVFGAKCLRPAGRGVRFEPSERDLRRRLGEIAGDGFVRAGQVKLLFEEIADHDAIHMRNAIVRSCACAVPSAHSDMLDSEGDPQRGRAHSCLGEWRALSQRIARSA